jgi:hypothetical protein
MKYCSPSPKGLPIPTHRAGRLHSRHLACSHIWASEASGQQKRMAPIVSSNCLGSSQSISSCLQIGRWGRSKYVSFMTLTSWKLGREFLLPVSTRPKRTNNRPNLICGAVGLSRMNQHHILLILIPPETPQIIFGKAEPLPTPNGLQKLPTKRISNTCI